MKKKADLTFLRSLNSNEEKPNSCLVDEWQGENFKIIFQRFMILYQQNNGFHHNRVYDVL
jgi:hypothetical protein